MAAITLTEMHTFLESKIVENFGSMEEFAKVIQNHFEEEMSDYEYMMGCLYDND